MFCAELPEHGALCYACLETTSREGVRSLRNLSEEFGIQETQTKQGPWEPEQEPEPKTQQGPWEPEEQPQASSNKRRRMS